MKASTQNPAARGRKELAERPQAGPSGANGEIRAGSRAFTLLEVIGVLVILAVLAGFLVPVMLRHLDRVASRQEIHALQTLSDALQQGICRTRHIPNQADWPAFIATQAGLDLGAVTNNVRKHPRVFLLDPSRWFSANMSYTQTSIGTPDYPANARVMLVSSLGKDLPLTSGMPLDADFQALWDTPPGTVPNTGAWAGWKGDPDDVKIQRVNLSPLFVRLVLSTYTSATNGQYAIEPSSTNLVPSGNGLAGYFLKGSVLRLFSGPPGTRLDSSQVLNEDTSFVYEGGTWKRSIQGRITLGVGDVSGIVAAFLASTPNLNAQHGTNQQALVVQTMADYMGNYNAWAATSFTNTSLRDYLLKTNQPAMMSAVQGLYGKIGGTSYYPSNGIPCP